MRGGLRTIVILGGLGAIAVGIVVFAYLAIQKRAPAPRAPISSKLRHQQFGNYTLWWDDIPEQLREDSRQAGPETNIHPGDYAGPDSCKGCHPKQYESWSKHPHRWMNSLVENTIVRGDFNNQQVSYLGGLVTFSRAAEQYRMRLERGDIRREYVVEQTIGSRLFQYYVGKQLEGPESRNHPVYSEAHVLPMGYWLDRREWVPIVHVGGEFQEGERPDPFVERPAYSGNLSEYADSAHDLYRSQCNFCHTTFALGDMFVRFQPTLGRHIPARVDVSLAEYVRNTRPELWPAKRSPSDMSNGEFAELLREYHRFEAKDHAITLGVSCEACHLGAKEHADGNLKRPRFFPNSPEVVVHSKTGEYDRGRTHDNINWVCGRCHAGDRPQFANGSSTWNSTEYTDAMRGGCYSQLTCTRCHNPHESIGHEWSHTPAEDDAVCLSCHQKFEPEPARKAHTHHALDQEGSRCMNCHMPRINEGLQEVVRTHTIFSPTNRATIESNHVNACNQCHVDQPIDWTLSHLKTWYGRTYSERAIAANYPMRNRPAAIGWLKGTNEAVRLVAADSLTRADARWALPDLIRALDDPYLLNRQFARIGLERMLGLTLGDFGYQFYQTRAERAAPLRKLRAEILPAKAGPKAADRDTAGH